jgi:outer membrane protein OmpA-like peptidoglycan-associated protein
MRIILLGLLAFVLWSGTSTYLYVCKIKQLCPDDSDQKEVGAQSVEQSAEPTDIASAAAQIDADTVAVPSIVSPGSFVVFHSFNERNFTADQRFDDYLKETKAYVEQMKGVQINVIGHTDSRGSEAYNKELGLDRAKRTKEYLVEKGIPAELITTSSQGESSPEASNDTAEGRAKNRRTEIEINN